MKFRTRRGGLFPMLHKLVVEMLLLALTVHAVYTILRWALAR